MLLKVLFFGSSDYCLPVLESLIKNFNLTAVITRPLSPPQKFGLARKIPVFTPRSAGEISALIPALKKLSPDISIVADYGLMIPDDIISLPKFETLNIHFSRLPKYRGPSPVQYTILNGEKSAWISVIKLVKKLDAGDIICRKEVSLTGDETTGSLYKKLFNIISEDLPDILTDFALNRIKSIKQDDSQSTYTRKITKEDGFIPWEILTSAMGESKQIKPNIDSWPFFKIIPKLDIGNWKLEITHAVRAFTPWPGVWTEIKFKVQSSKIKNKEKRLKILKAHLEREKLILDQVQLEGKNPVSWKQFREGYDIVL